MWSVHMYTCNDGSTCRFSCFAGIRQHFTTKPPASATTFTRAGALVPPPPCLGGGITRVGPGQYPQYTRAHFGEEALGSSPQCDHRQPRRDNRQAQQSSRDDEVPHVSPILKQGEVSSTMCRCASSCGFWKRPLWC